MGGTVKGGGGAAIKHPPGQVERVFDCGIGHVGKVGHAAGTKRTLRMRIIPSACPLSPYCPMSTGAAPTTCKQSQANACKRELTVPTTLNHRLPKANGAAEPWHWVGHCGRAGQGVAKANAQRQRVLTHCRVRVHWVSHCHGSPLARVNACPTIAHSEHRSTSICAAHWLGRSAVRWSLIWWDAGHSCPVPIPHWSAGTASTGIKG